jgi:hypothetical protein
VCHGSFKNTRLSLPSVLSFQFINVSLSVSEFGFGVGLSDEIDKWEMLMKCESTDMVFTSCCIN